MNVQYTFDLFCTEKNVGKIFRQLTQPLCLCTMYMGDH